MLGESVVLHFGPFAQPLLANRAGEPMLVLLVLLHLQISTAFEIAYLALELDNARMNPLVRNNLLKICPCQQNLQHYMRI